MTEQKKNRLQALERRVNEFSDKPLARKLRISSGVAWNLFIVALVFTLVFSTFIASVGAGYFASLVAKEPLRSPDEMRNRIFSYEETSEIYLANNHFLGKVNADIERKKTHLENVSPFVIDAVFATEDEYFEEHEGIVPKAIFRGIFQDVTNSASQTGGSTLTQQLIKIQILTNEVSYERKAKEILLAMRLEHFMEKEEILEAYLNIIPYGRNIIGQNIAGVETAADGIFGVTAKELTLPQAAYIAGIPQAPFTYTPFYSENRGIKEPELLQPGIDRMKTVLFRMKETGYITPQQYTEAIAYDITQDFREPMQRASETYPYLTQEIQNRAVDVLARVIAEKDGIDPARLDEEAKLREKYLIEGRRSMMTDGYRIHSTINHEMYEKMNEVAENYKQYGHTFKTEVVNKETGEKEVLENPVQVGSILIENHSGRILSFIGGRGYEQEALNHATQAYRQNGSSMKPLLVYAPAIEYGRIGAGSPVVDVRFKAAGWSPTNFIPNQELGILPAREALARSQNLATARLYRDIIDKKPADFLQKMNFSKLQEVDYESYSTSFGGMQIGTSVEENTNAYATFANGGKFIESYMIEKIEDMEGNIVYEHRVEPVDVFSPQTAYIITDMLRDVANKSYGTANMMRNNLNFRTDIAAKTGTTNNFADMWLVGYNPNVSLGVWLGYKDKRKGLNDVKKGYLQPSQRVNVLYAKLLNAAHSAAPDVVSAQAKFERPKGVVSRSFCSISGMSPSKACAAAGLVTSDLFNSHVMVPGKTDDSIISAASVSINGVHYAALPSTPSEFIVQGGAGVNDAFLTRMLGPWGGNKSKLFSEKTALGKKVVGGAQFNADGVAPASVSASASGNTLVWSASSSNDVIGYYVYKNGARIATIRDGQSRSFTMNSGAYTIYAVDITGKLSAPSNTIGAQPESTPEPEIPDQPSTPDDSSQESNEKPVNPENGNDPKEENEPPASPSTPTS